MAALDSTIIATLVPPISTSFSSFTALSWLASAYLIAMLHASPSLADSPIYSLEEVGWSSPTYSSE